MDKKPGRGKSPLAALALPTPSAEFNREPLAEQKCGLQSPTSRITMYGRISERYLLYIWHRYKFPTVEGFGFFFNFLKIIYLFIYLFIYLLAVLGLRCSVWTFSSWGERGLLFVEVPGLLFAVTSLVVEHRL